MLRYPILYIFISSVWIFGLSQITVVCLNGWGILRFSWRDMRRRISSGSYEICRMYSGSIVEVFNTVTSGRKYTLLAPNVWSGVKHASWITSYSERLRIIAYNYEQPFQHFQLFCCMLFVHPFTVLTIASWTTYLSIQHSSAICWQIC